MKQLRAGLAWFVLPALAVESALSGRLLWEWLTQRLSFYLPTLGGITIAIYLAQLVLWPVAFLAILVGARRLGRMAALGAGAMAALSVALSDLRLPYPGIPLLGVLVAIAVASSWREPEVWRARRSAWPILAALLLGLFLVLPLAAHLNAPSMGELGLTGGPLWLHLGGFEVRYGQLSFVGPVVDANPLALVLFGLWLIAAGAGLRHWRDRPEVGLAVVFFGPAVALLTYGSGGFQFGTSSWPSGTLVPLAVAVGACLLLLELILGWGSAAGPADEFDSDAETVPLGSSGGSLRA